MAPSRSSPSPSTSFASGPEVLAGAGRRDGVRDRHKAVVTELTEAEFKDVLRTGGKGEG